VSSGVAPSPDFDAAFPKALVVPLPKLKSRPDRDAQARTPVPHESGFSIHSFVMPQLPQRLKPANFNARYGTTEVVP